MIAAAALALALAPQDQAIEQRPPNVVFVLADDLGWGDLGCYGQTKLRTPNLDRMAAEGLRFTEFYAGATVCAPSRCVLMTGRHTGRCYIRGNGKLNLRPDDVTVAEVMKSRGYRTALFGKWGLGHEDSDGLPTRQGFDRFFGYLDQHHAHNYWPTFLVRDEERVALRNVVPDEGKWGQGVATKRVDYSHDLVFDETLKFVAENADEPFFLYVAATIPHANNEARKQGMEVPELGPFAELDWPEPQKALGAMVHRLDRDVGRLLTLLREKGIAEHTCVMFSSDNGPHREGGNDPDFQNSNGPLRGIKRSLHDGGIRVPTIAWWPGTIAPGRETDHVAGFVDLLATCGELAGAEVAVEHDGISFVPTLLGDAEAQASHDYLYWEFYEGGSAQAVRAGRWKAIRAPMFDGELRLYDLTNDIGEERDVADEHADIVRRMTEAMDDAHEPSPLWRVKQRR